MFQDYQKHNELVFSWATELLQNNPQWPFLVTLLGSINSQWVELPDLRLLSIDVKIGSGKNQCSISKQNEIKTIQRDLARSLGTSVTYRKTNEKSKEETWLLDFKTLDIQFDLFRQDEDFNHNA